MFLAAKHVCDLEECHEDVTEQYEQFLSRKCNRIPLRNLCQNRTQIIRSYHVTSRE